MDGRQAQDGDGMMDGPSWTDSKCTQKSDRRRANTSKRSQKGTLGEHTTSKDGQIGRASCRERVL